MSCSASGDDPALTLRVHAEGRRAELLISGEVAAGPAEYESSPRLSIDRERTHITVRPDEQSLLGRKQPEIAFHIVTRDRASVDAIGGDELLFDGSKDARSSLLCDPHPHFDIVYVDNSWHTQ